MCTIVDKFLRYFFSWDMWISGYTASTSYSHLSNGVRYKARGLSPDLTAPTTITAH